MTNEELLEKLDNLSVLELIAVTKHLEEKWGVKAAPQPVQVTTQVTTEKVAEQTEFSIVLTSVPADKKMNTIKAIREILTLGLKESKDFVEAAPKLVKEGISKEEVEDIKKKLAEAGAEVEVK